MQKSIKEQLDDLCEAFKMLGIEEEKYMSNKNSVNRDTYDLAAVIAFKLKEETLEQLTKIK